MSDEDCHSFLQIHFIMGQPKQIVLTFTASDSKRPAPPKSEPVESTDLPPVSFHKLTVPFTQLEDVKKAINACFARGEGFSRNFKGDRLTQRLQILSRAGRLNSKEVEILINDITGSTIQYSGAEKVDLELIAGKFSIVSFKFLMSVEKN